MYEDQTETLESYKSERSPGSSDTRKSWSDTRSGPVGSSPATSTLFSAPSHKASRESMAEASFKSNRRHTFTPPVRREELDDVFRAEEERVHRRQESETTEREMQRTSPGSLRNGNGLQPAHVPSPRPRTAPSTFDDEERPTSSQRPRTAPSTFEDEDRSVRSPRPPRPNSRMSATIAGLRSGAGRDWVKENQRLWLGTDGEGPPSPSDSVAVQASHTANGSRTASPFVARSSTKPSVSRRWTQESTLGDDRSSGLEIDVRRAVPKVANESDAWYPSTPDRATHRQNAKAAKQALAESLNGGGNGGDEDAEMSMARIRGMDKLEIFFKCVCSFSSSLWSWEN